MLSCLPRGLKTVLQPHTSTHFRRHHHASSWLSLNAVAAKTRSPSNSSATSTFQLPSRLSALPSLFEMDMIVATCPASHPRIIFRWTRKRYSGLMRDLSPAGFHDEVQFVEWSPVLCVRFQNQCCLFVMIGLPEFTLWTWFIHSLSLTTGLQVKSTCWYGHVYMLYSAVLCRIFASDEYRHLNWRNISSETIEFYEGWKYVHFLFYVKKVRLSIERRNIYLKKGHIFEFCIFVEHN